MEGTGKQTKMETGVQEGLRRPEGLGNAELHQKILGRIPGDSSTGEGTKETAETKGRGGTGESVGEQPQTGRAEG